MNWLRNPREDLVRGDRAREKGNTIVGPPAMASASSILVIIGFGSTFCRDRAGNRRSLCLLRFKVPLKDDLLFFILSTG
jgi:multiple sugar transport system permease protein